MFNRYCTVIVMLALAFGCTKKGTEQNGSSAKNTKEVKVTKEVEPIKEVKSPTAKIPSAPKNTINKDGIYTVTEKLPERYVCKTAADCDESRFTPGRCCKTKCPLSRVGGTKDWVTAVRKLWNKRCKAWHAKHRYSCSYPKCYPKGTPRVACVKNKCTVEYKPLK